MIASIPSPSSNGIGLGPFEIHAYGLMYALAVTAAILIVRRRWRNLGGDPDLVYDVAIWGFPAGLLGGRIYFDITSFNEMPHTWYGPIAVWDGGLGIWGGIAGGAAVGIWRVHRAGVSVPDFMDCDRPRPARRPGDRPGRQLLQPGALRRPDHPPLGASRSPPPTARGLPPLRHLPADLPLRDHLEPRPGGLPGLARPPPQDRPPGLFALYVVGYSAFRIFEESLRVDPAHHFLGQRLNFWVAIVLVLVGARLVRLDPAAERPRAAPTGRSKYAGFRRKPCQLRRASVTTSALYNFALCTRHALESRADEGVRRMVGDVVRFGEATGRRLVEVLKERGPEAGVLTSDSIKGSRSPEHEGVDE